MQNFTLLFQRVKCIHCFFHWNIRIWPMNQIYINIICLQIMERFFTFPHNLIRRPTAYILSINKFISTLSSQDYFFSYTKFMQNLSYILFCPATIISRCCINKIDSTIYCCLDCIHSTFVGIKIPSGTSDSPCTKAHPGYMKPGLSQFCILHFLVRLRYYSLFFIIPLSDCETNLCLLFYLKNFCYKIKKSRKTKTG